MNVLVPVFHQKREQLDEAGHHRGVGLLVLIARKHGVGESLSHIYGIGPSIHGSAYKSASLGVRNIDEGQLCTQGEHRVVPSGKAREGVLLTGRGHRCIARALAEIARTREG